MKTCSKCGVEKPFSDYYAHPRGANGLYSYCRACHQVHLKAHREANHEAILAREAERRARPERRAQKRAYQQRYRHENREAWNEAQRRSKMKRYYGITPEEFDQLLQRQDFCCAICSDSLETVRPHIDHIDTPGGPVVRGILCMNCNTALGHLRESSALLRRAAEYVARFEVTAS